jgi:hypothetical protein
MLAITNPTVRETYQNLVALAQEHSAYARIFFTEKKDVAVGQLEAFAGHSVVFYRTQVGPVYSEVVANLYIVGVHTLKAVGCILLCLLGVATLAYLITLLLRFVRWRWAVSKVKRNAVELPEVTHDVVYKTLRDVVPIVADGEWFQQVTHEDKQIRVPLGFTPGLSFFPFVPPTRTSGGPIQEGLISGTDIGGRAVDEGPKCQVDIYDANRNLVGSGYRDGDHLSTAGHVCKQLQRVGTTYYLAAMGTRALFEVEHSKVVINNFFLDEALLTVAPEIWSVAGIKAATKAALRSDYIELYYSEPTGTIRRVFGRREAGSLPGYFTHTANTKPGMSGSPIFDTKGNVCGSHKGQVESGKKNYGSYNTLSGPLSQLRQEAVDGNTFQESYHYREFKENMDINELLKVWEYNEKKKLFRPRKETKEEKIERTRKGLERIKRIKKDDPYEFEDALDGSRLDDAEARERNESQFQALNSLRHETAREMHRSLREHQFVWDPYSQKTVRLMSLKRRRNETFESAITTALHFDEEEVADSVNDYRLPLFVDISVFEASCFRDDFWWVQALPDCPWYNTNWDTFRYGIGEFFKLDLLSPMIPEPDLTELPDAEVEDYFDPPSTDLFFEANGEETAALTVSPPPGVEHSAPPVVELEVGLASSAPALVHLDPDSPVLEEELFSPPLKLPLEEEPLMIELRHVLREMVASSTQESMTPADFSRIDRLLKDLRNMLPINHPELLAIHEPAFREEVDKFDTSLTDLILNIIKIRDEQAEETKAMEEHHRHCVLYNIRGVEAHKSEKEAYKAHILELEAEKEQVRATNGLLALRYRDECSALNDLIKTKQSEIEKLEHENLERKALMKILQDEVVKARQDKYVLKAAGDQVNVDAKAKIRELEMKRAVIGPAPKADVVEVPPRVYNGSDVLNSEVAALVIENKEVFMKLLNLVPHYETEAALNSSSPPLKSGTLKIDSPKPEILPGKNPTRSEVLEASAAPSTKSALQESKGTKSGSAQKRKRDRKKGPSSSTKA